MSKRMKKKSLAMICVQLVCTIALGAFLLLIQNNLSVSAQQRATPGRLRGRKFRGDPGHL